MSSKTTHEHNPASSVSDPDFVLSRDLFLMSNDFTLGRVFGIEAKQFRPSNTTVGSESYGVMFRFIGRW